MSRGPARELVSRAPNNTRRAFGIADKEPTNIVSRAMREVAMAFSPLVAVIYFVVFPSQFVSLLHWFVQVLR
jgi:hypothetical protein